MKLGAIIALLLGLLASCGPKPRPLPVLTAEEQEKSLLEWNKQVLANEVRSIEVYLKKKQIDYQRTETGLYVFDEVLGDGTAVGDGDKVWISYSIELLDGSHCFKTDSLMPVSFVIGRNRLPVGLNEGVKRLNEGGRAKLIIPHYLLHGIVGDRKNIPPITPALFNLRLLKVEKR